MSELLRKSDVKRITGLELNALQFAGVLDRGVFDGSHITSSGTPIYDIDGELLFYRVPVRRGQKASALADVAANSVFGAPLLAVQHGLEWEEQQIKMSAEAAARKIRSNIDFDKMEFVAYSYPKMAIRFSKGNNEILMLELFSWTQVPSERDVAPGPQEYGFSRWSLVRETPEEKKQKNITNYRKRVSQWDELFPPLPPKLRKESFKPEYIKYAEFERQLKAIPTVPRIETRDLYYSLDDNDHHPCYELRGQQTGVWCVAASVQMLLDFYRYDYEQTRVAQALNLGTLTNPNSLPYANDGDVVTVIESMTGNALNATMNTNPSWTEFRGEIRANHPLISFIPGHSRTVAGYTRTSLFEWYVFRGLLVYDPWPPNAGVITRWENFDTQTYRRTFTAAVTMV